MENGQQIHGVFLPFFTTSHMIPLVNAAKVFAFHGVKVTIISTPANTALFSSTIDQEIRLGHKISVSNVRFPSAELELPEGKENIASATSPEMMTKIHKGFSLLKEPIENLILNQIRPHFIVSDMFYPWTNDVAEKLNIPRLLFYPNSFISHCLPYNLEKYSPHEKVNSDSESFLIPGLPHQIQMKRSQLEEHVKTKTRFGEIIDVVKGSEIRSYGMIHDTIYDLESAYVDYYKKLKGQKYWTIGPLFHISNRGQETEERHSCLDWLDAQEPKSVLFISFGSLTRFSDAQLKEISLALEATNQPFIWVVRNREKTQENDEQDWLISKNNERGLIITTWAPQLMILRHPSVGGFMTHCGWNSILEAITSGVPLITWPLFAEQFYNEKLIEIQQLGVGVGSDVWNVSPILNSDVLLSSKRIEEAINRLMGNSEESKKIRQNAEDAAAMANKAVEEGGSSYQNIVSLIEELKSCAFGFSK